MSHPPAHPHPDLPVMSEAVVDDPATVHVDLRNLSPRALRGLRWYAEVTGNSLAGAAVIFLNESEHPDEPPTTFDGPDHQLRFPDRDEG